VTWLWNWPQLKDGCSEKLFYFIFLMIQESSQDPRKFIVKHKRARSKLPEAFKRGWTFVVPNCVCSSKPCLNTKNVFVPKTFIKSSAMAFVMDWDWCSQKDLKCFKNPHPSLMQKFAIIIRRGGVFLPSTKMSFNQPMNNSFGNQGSVRLLVAKIKLITTLSNWFTSNFRCSRQFKH